jgi:hypothetical protein
MRKTAMLAVTLVVVALVLGVAAPALAAVPGGTVNCTVQPVTGGPNNPSTFTTPAQVTIPFDNPAIRDDGLAPGEVFVPAGD